MNYDGHFDIVWPEYSGNRFYQSLGNLHTTPFAGLVFPDFDTGDVLYVTGNADVLIGSEANALIPRSNLAVKLAVKAARYVQKGLPFRRTVVEPSPYNPKFRPLATENVLDVDCAQVTSNFVILQEQTWLTPTISRFRFSMKNPASCKPGQWVAFDFSDKLKVGYKHMNDEDPRSLNDDYVRTFTVSSPPSMRRGSLENEFEVTARKVGVVTAFLFRHQGGHQLEIRLRGFGGDFSIEQNPSTSTPFVAGGVGITPVLALLPSLETTRLKLYWTLHIDDVNLVKDTFQRHPSLGASTKLFLTGNSTPKISQVAISELH